MLKLLFSFFALLFFVPFAFAQPEPPPHATTLDLAISPGDVLSVAVSGNYLFGFGSKKRFKVGPQLRLSSYNASGPLDYLTAPANLTSDEAKMDTFRVAETQLNALNLGILFQYSLSKNFDIGVNIDAVGLSFGAQQTGSVLATGSLFNETTLNTRSSSPNILLGGDNDRGSLNSEFYLRYWFSPRLGFRAGLSYNFLEYRAEKAIAFDNDRFRHKFLQPLIAISFKL